MVAAKQNDKKMQIILSGLWFITVPFLWYVATVWPEFNFGGEMRTRSQLRRLQELVAKHKTVAEHLPRDIAELRIFALQNQYSFSLYDGFARRIQYETLSKDHYCIKSFGEDGAENTIHSPLDPCVCDLPPTAAEPPLYDYASDAKAQLFPALLLMGARAPMGSLTAEIQVDYDNQKRTLVVRDLNRPEFILTAAHPGIEEFFWLPSGYEIVFSATSSIRYHDGIYVWDLLTNQMRNLLEDFVNDIHVKSNAAEKHFFISLSGIDEGGHSLYAFIAADQDNSLPPEQFFSKKNLYKISLPKDDRTHVTFDPAFKNKKGDVFESAPIQLTSGVQTGPLGLPVQAIWGHLPTTGPMFSVIDQWQEFSVTYPKTPLFPYSLWYLSSIYADSFRQMAGPQPKQAQTLRAFGMELSKALSRLSMAPSYLRAMSIYMFQELKEGKPLNYRISDLNPPKDR